jgi:hypothetical protein
MNQYCLRTQHLASQRRPFQAMLRRLLERLGQTKNRLVTEHLSREVKRSPRVPLDRRLDFRSGPAGVYQPRLWVSNSTPSGGDWELDEVTAAGDPPAGGPAAWEKTMAAAVA